MEERRITYPDPGALSQILSLIIEEEGSCKEKDPVSSSWVLPRQVKKLSSKSMKSLPRKSNQVHRLQLKWQVRKGTVVRREGWRAVTILSPLAFLYPLLLVGYTLVAQQA